VGIIKKRHYQFSGKS